MTSSPFDDAIKTHRVIIHGQLTSLPAFVKDKQWGWAELCMTEIEARVKKIREAFDHIKKES